MPQNLLPSAKTLRTMPDIAFIGDSTFLFEKLFQEMSLECQFIKPAVFCSPFLPEFRMILIPTGFANPMYSDILPSLRRCRSKIASFVEKGGMLTVFGPVVSEHDYDWLPLSLKYIQDYQTCEILESKKHECSSLINKFTVDCDGYLIAGEEFDVILTDSRDNPVLVLGRLGEGFIVVTSIHEFPSVKYMLWAVNKGRRMRI